MDAMKIGKRLTKLRNNRPLSAVAKEIKVSISALSMYENGRRIPKDEIKIRIANYYNTTVDSIFYNSKLDEM